MQFRIIPDKLYIFLKDNNLTHSIINIMLTRLVFTSKKTGK